MKKIFLALLFLFPLSVRAETFSVVPITTNVNVNQLFQVDLVLDAHDDDVNAVEGILQYPHDLLQLKEIHDERSPITLWIKHPTANITSDSEFSGMIPGGTEDAQARQMRADTGKLRDLHHVRRQQREQHQGPGRLDGYQDLRDQGAGAGAMEPAHEGLLPHARRDP